MKKIFNLVAVGMVLASVNVNAQTYVNEMTQADVERDCYIEGGSALFNDAADAYYGDGSYVQKSSASTPTAFIFNRDILGNKNLTGLMCWSPMIVWISTSLLKSSIQPMS